MEALAFNFSTAGAPDRSVAFATKILVTEKSTVQSIDAL
jgi:hypothetical protein